MNHIKKETLQFLEKLKANNNRDWFTENKIVFTEHQDSVKSFFNEVAKNLNKTDNIEGHKVYRIYRDVRFSKDKTPYKGRFAGAFTRATSALRGGYYLNIEPGNSIAGGGFYSPNPEDLLRIRKEFELDDFEIREILNKKGFKKMFGSIIGHEVKTAPRGFAKDHKALDLIRKKQFILIREFTDEEVLQPNFIKEVEKTYKTIRPFFDFMSDVLTTNLNGESVL